MLGRCLLRLSPVSDRRGNLLQQRVFLPFVIQGIFAHGAILLETLKVAGREGKHCDRRLVLVERGEETGRGKKVCVSTYLIDQFVGRQGPEFFERVGKEVSKGGAKMRAVFK